jgi:dTDP-4-amino-4,6-dideoxygalactose transaminase
VHDCANSVRRGVGLPKFAGYNFRASELTGAMARVQLTRLDGLLERMRANHARLTAEINGLPGLRLRRANDEDGDAGIALIAFADDAKRAAEAVAALNAEGVLAMQIYSPATPDLHVFPFWAPVLAAIEADGRRAPDCPGTLGLLERSIHIDVSPLCEERDLDEIAFAFEKVAKRVLA